MGLFADMDGRAIGVCDRHWYHYRKGNLATECSIGSLLRALLSCSQQRQGIVEATTNKTAENPD